MKTIIPAKNISTAELYRMPWTMSDNAFTWLEPTRKCNMACEYCYQRNDPNSQKSLVQIEMELRALFRLRKCDTLLIAGGEPLTHPQIVAITKMVKDFGVKPVILTNGMALTRTLVHDLKKAGAFGFVFHVDSHQLRPGWEGKSEKELKAVRKLFKRRFLTLLKNPWALFEKLSIQNIIVMQPHDFLPNGEQDECDGCPNKKYWNGRLVSECRNEDYLIHGRPIITVRRGKADLAVRHAAS